MDPGYKFGIKIIVEVAINMMALVCYSVYEKQKSAHGYVYSESVSGDLMSCSCGRWLSFLLYSISLINQLIVFSEARCRH